MDIWQVLMTPFSWLLKQFCLLFDSYGIALILFTIIIKLILAPFQFKGKKSMIKMNILNAQQQEIKARYPNNPAKQNEELQKLYAENGVSSMSGCLWSFIPILILWPLYAIIRRPMKYMMWLTEASTTAVAGVLGWENFTTAGTNELILASQMNAGNLADASTAAGTNSLFLINFNFLNLDLSQVPSWKFWDTGVSWSTVGLFLMPVISAGLALLSTIVLTKTNAMNRQQEETARSQNMMMMLMQPVLSLWIGFTLPAGMCIYWISNSVLTTAQELIFGRILKKDYEEAQKKIAEQAAAAKIAEKERRRAQAEKKAAALAEKKTGKKKGGQPKKKENDGPVIDKSASRVGMRQYARGRAYDPNRYPVTPYHDPNEKKKPEDEEENAALTDEEKELLAESSEGAALLAQAETAQAEIGQAEENGEEAVEEPSQAESEAMDTAHYDTPVYDKPNFDHETKE